MAKGKATPASFKKGHPCVSPGRPKLPKELLGAKKAMAGDFLEACDKIIEIEKIVEKVYEMALDGDMRAVEIILDRCIGAVPRNLNLRGLVHHTSESDSLLIDELAKRCAIPTTGKIKPE